MKALTVRPPWSWAIAYGGKAIENRPRGTSHRGLLAIHAGTRWDEDGAADPRVIAAAGGATAGPLLPDDPRFVFGAIIAIVDLTGTHGSHACVRTHSLGHLHPDGPYECSAWASGGDGGLVHWELANVHPLGEPVSCRGWLNLWEVPPEVEAAVRAQLGANA